MTSAVFFAVDVVNACIAADAENVNRFVRKRNALMCAEANKPRWSWSWLQLGYSQAASWSLAETMRKLEKGDEFSEWHQLEMDRRWRHAAIVRVKELAEIAAAGAIDGTITLCPDDMRVIENFIQLRS